MKLPSISLGVLSVSVALMSGVAPAALAGTPHPSAPVDVPSCTLHAPGKATCMAQALGHLNPNGKPTANRTNVRISGYTPANLQQAYNLPSSTAGYGQIIAIVDAYANPTAQSDLNVYRSQFGLPATTVTQVNESGGSISTVPGDTGWGQEESLDLQIASAVCPNCSIIYVGANSPAISDLATAENEAASMGATVISNSYGTSEFGGETSYDSAYTHPGVAITASTGDNGYGVEWPAANPNVTAVGGTTLKIVHHSVRGYAESVWSGSGSGCSAYETKPSWQLDTGCAARTVGDTAADANPSTGVAVYDSYGSTSGSNWYVFGGTSVGSPIIAGTYALAGNAVTAGSGASYLYGHATTSDVNDITSGSDGTCTPAYLCTGEVGYDGPTGVGTPNGVAGF